MEENESKQGQDLAQDLKIQFKIEEAIELAIFQNKETVTLEDGKTIIVLRVVMGKERDTYDVFFDEDSILVTAKRDSSGKISYQGYKLDLLNKMQKRYNVERMRIVATEEQRQKRKIEKLVEKGKDYKDILPKGRQQQALNLEMDKKIKNGNAQQLEIDREVSTTENMRMFVQRAWGISAKEIYRVKGNDSHSFKYVAKTGNSKKPYQEIELSHFNEGRNSMQKIWVMEDGTLKQKTVDSLPIKGNCGIATDVADSVISQNTRTYLIQRTPRGQYIGIAVGQKQGVNRNTSGDSTQKDIMSRENSIYDLEDVIAAALLAEKIYGFNKDGKLTTKEVEIVRRLKFDRNMDDNEVANTVKAVCFLREKGFEPQEIKDIMEKVDGAIEKIEKGEVKKLQEEIPGGDDEQKTMHDGHDGTRRRPHGWE